MTERQREHRSLPLPVFLASGGGAPALDLVLAAWVSRATTSPHAGDGLAVFLAVFITFAVTATVCADWILQWATRPRR
jgi:hypothetical protein